MSIRILIVDDYEALWQSIRCLLETRSEFEICGEAKDGAKGVEKAAELKPLEKRQSRLDGGRQSMRTPR
jgi:DNA-binding NarL/FixJ family response regulator